jgi:hypothetical protein
LAGETLRDISGAWRVAAKSWRGRERDRAGFSAPEERKSLFGGRHEEKGMDHRNDFRDDPNSKVKLSNLDSGYKGKHESPGYLTAHMMSLR